METRLQDSFVMLEALQSGSVQSTSSQAPVSASGFAEVLAEAAGSVASTGSPQSTAAKGSSPPSKKPDEDNEVAEDAPVLLVNTPIIPLLENPTMPMDGAQTEISAPRVEPDSTPQASLSAAAAPKSTEPAPPLDLLLPVSPTLSTETPDAQVAKEEGLIRVDVSVSQTAQETAPLKSVEENDDLAPADGRHKIHRQNQIKPATPDLVPEVTGRSQRRIESRSDVPIGTQTGTEAPSLDSRPEDTGSKHQDLFTAGKHTYDPTADMSPDDKLSPSSLATHAPDRSASNDPLSADQFASLVSAPPSSSHLAENLFPSSTTQSHAAPDSGTPAKPTVGSVATTHFASEVQSFPERVNPGAAHILARAERQEMQFTYTTPEFGEIEIRTTVKHDQVGAVISVPDVHLRDLLHSNIESLDHALSQQSLQLGSFQTTTSDSHSERERAFESHYSPMPWVETREAENIVLSHVETYYHNGALDLRA